MLSGLFSVVAVVGAVVVLLSEWWQPEMIRAARVIKIVVRIIGCKFICCGFWLAKLISALVYVL
jgi:hypothetical protein